MSPDQRNQLNRLMAEDAALMEELSALNGPKYPAAMDAIIDLLQQRAGFLRREISDAKWKRLSATSASPGSSSKPIVLQHDRSPLISEAERRAIASRY